MGGRSLCLFSGGKKIQRGRMRLEHGNWRTAHLKQKLHDVAVIIWPLKDAFNFGRIPTMKDISIIRIPVSPLMIPCADYKKRVTQGPLS